MNDILIDLLIEERDTLRKKLDIAVETLKEIADDRLRNVDFTRVYQTSAQIALKKLEDK